MSETVRQRVRVWDIARGALSASAGLPMVLRQSPGMLLRRPGHQIGIAKVFQRLAARQPDHVFLLGDGRTISYGEANRIANRYAHYFESRGVTKGDVVGLMSPNDPEFILVLLGVVKLGAIAGLLNYHQRDEVLAHSLRILDATLVVVADDCRDDLATAGDAVDDDSVVTISQLRTDSAEFSDQNPPVAETILGSDKALYIFTSGTQGMPKVSIMSHFRWMRSYSGLGGLGVRLGRDDVLYCALPLYHNNAVTVGLGAVLVAGATMAIAPKFSASRFWDECIAYDATAFVYIGEFCRYLLSQPVKPTDRQHKVRVIVGNGLRPDIWNDFRNRFGIERIAEFYGASECNIAFINALNIDQTAGTCPLPHKVVAYDTETGAPTRDETGRLTKVKPGEVGLLLAVVNDRVPFDGYTDAAASESKLVRDAFRDGDCWFNTGDLVRRQGWQHVAFVDRLGDTFRWKGENVATTEVEAVIAHLDWVEECTVYGVNVPGADGKAGMAAIVVKEGAQFDPAELAAQVTAALPSYAWPLFVRIVQSLEYTSTFKSRKVELRERGFEAAAGEPVHVLTQPEAGYEPFYPGYPQDVVAGQMPKF